MKLVYTMPQGGEKEWPVRELTENVCYKLLDDDGKDRILEVSGTEGGAYYHHLLDGFVIEGNDVYSVSLLSGTPRFLVGHSPRIV